MALMFGHSLDASLLFAPYFIANLYTWTPYLHTCNPNLHSHLWPQPTAIVATTATPAAAAIAAGSAAATILLPGASCPPLLPPPTFLLMLIVVSPAVAHQK